MSWICGSSTLTTHIFVANSPHIDSDAVFAVKKSLVVDFAIVEDEETARRYGLTVPFRLARFDLVLAPLAASKVDWLQPALSRAVRRSPA